MASIRRTLSPVPRPGAINNGEACQVASPLSKSSSNSQNYPSPQVGVLSSLLNSLDYALYKAQSFVLGLFSQRSSRPVDRSRMKGQIWRRAYLYFLMCFFVGIFIGLTPFVPLNISTNVEFELRPLDGGDELHVRKKNEISVDGEVSLKENNTLEPEKVNVEVYNHTLWDNTSGLNGDVAFDKLLIIITPTHTRPLQAYFLSRLVHTLKLIRDPLLWIVVEMNSQSMETAELLRNSGVMYRHLVGSFKNATEIKDKSALLRNVALSHIETHRLDGIAYFADDDKIYSAALFNQMRNIRYFRNLYISNFCICLRYYECPITRLKLIYLILYSHLRVNQGLFEYGSVQKFLVFCKESKIMSLTIFY